MKDAVDVLNEKITRLRQENEKLHADLFAADAHALKLRNENEALHESIEEWKADFNQMRQENEKLHADLFAADANALRLRNESEALKKQITGMTLARLPISEDAERYRLARSGKANVCIAVIEKDPVFIQGYRPVYDSRADAAIDAAMKNDPDA